MMIRKANLLGKPVITATQMLESMIVNARPTRAECSDVANAVLDGTDAVMLSGETANGAHPLDAVGYMARTCCEAESITNHAALFAAIRESVLAEVGTMSISEAVASSAVKTAIDIGAKCIIVCSETGNSARLVAKYRPLAPILCLTATEDAARNVAGLCRGVTAARMGSMIGTDSIVHHVRAEEGAWGGGGTIGAGCECGDGARRGRRDPPTRRNHVAARLLETVPCSVLPSSTPRVHHAHPPISSPSRRRARW